jgi:hypothetical protein
MVMKKLLKIAASTVVYSALFVVALNAIFQLDLPSFANVAAMSLFSGVIHEALWA